MLHMSSTHQMQQIHLNDVTLICPYVGIMGVGVLSEYTPHTPTSGTLSGHK